jgi:hypothetical protein
MRAGLAALALLGALGAAQLDLDCSRPAASRSLIGRAMLSEIETAEDVNREVLWEAFGRCPAGPQADTCRDEQRRRFGADLARQKAAIESKYQQMLKDFEGRCYNPVT